MPASEDLPERDPQTAVFVLPVEQCLDLAAYNHLQIQGTEALTTQDLAIDLATCKELTPLLLASLLSLREKAQEMHRSFALCNASPVVQQRYTAWTTPDSDAAQTAPSREGWIEQVGGSCLSAYRNIWLFLHFQSEVAKQFFPFCLRRLPLKGSLLFRQMQHIGVDAVPIIALLALLVGLTLALQSANQLRQFGANIFIADLVAIGMTREMGPLMAAIILAGRTGAAMTSEIGAMVVTEEIDAMKGMAMNPMSYVIMPKVTSLLISQPLLTMLTNAIGIFGGFVVARLYLDIPLRAFVDETLAAVTLRDLLSGLAKSVVFAWLIAIVACFKGLHVGQGAEAVGQATTASVVQSLLAIIVADCAFSFVFYF